MNIKYGQRHLNYLHACYKRIVPIIGNNIEPFGSIALVEKYRQYWKPAKPKIILLAESHVFTRQEDMHIQIPEIPDLPEYPKEYVKFVYCLGYGESKLTTNISHPNRDGTWQFWKILYSCNTCIRSNEDFKPVMKGKNGTPFQERLRNKIALLKALKQKGIWLVDASIMALYDAGNKPKSAIMRKVIRTSWENYTQSVVTDAHPEAIICIGSGVFRVLENDLKRVCDEVYPIEQPNARLSSEEHLKNYQMYGNICG